MTGRRTSRVSFPAIISELLFALVVLLLVAASGASAEPSYSRTSLFTFPSSFSTAIAVEQGGSVIVGDIAQTFCKLARVSQGTYTPIYSYSGGSSQVYDVKIDGSGQFVVAEFGANTGSLVRISPSGSRSVIYSPASGKTVLAVDIDKDGGYIVYSSDYAGAYQALCRLASDGSVQETYALPRDSRGNGRVAVDVDGNYLVTQAGDSPGSSFARLLKVNRETGAITTVYEFDHDAFPFGLAVDGNGDYIVAEARNDVLSKITSGGQREVLFEFTAGTLPYGVDIDSAGDFFVAEVGTRTISKISSPNGATFDFPDVPASHPYYIAISGMATQQIIGGYVNGSFGPEDLVTRQQFSKMIVLTLGLPVSEDQFPAAGVPFVDLGGDNPSSLYPHEYVAVCALNNITKGTDATHFAPGLNIKRSQVITMVVRAADNLAAGALQAVPDGWSQGVLNYTDPTHGANIEKAEYNGLLAGIRANLSTSGLAGWNTGANATRGEVAQILWNLLQKLD
ncbi:MAG: S-layer homology domain-containing protein [Actinobacteria bacterium]|nr:S-layer homology domain-containing protein [Actinomycetota bacterium]